MKRANIPIFVSHLGCPNDCVFCNQKKITGHSGDVCGKDVESVVESWLSYIKGQAEIAFFGGSFTGIDIDLQNELLSAARKYVDGEKITGIRLSTRPDYINENIIENLLRYNVTTVELGAQSTSDEVLKAAKRGHSAKDIENASNLILESGINLGLQMMTHLPLADDEKDIKTCHDFIKMKPKEVRIYPTLVLKDTCLFEMYKKGDYTPQTLEEAVELTALLTEEFENAKISVIRTGLQPSDSLTEGFVAGPYHPAFGQMAQSRLILKRIFSYIDKTKCEFLNIRTEEKLVSKLYGQNRSNIREIDKKLNHAFKITVDKEITGIFADNEKIYE